MAFWGIELKPGKPYVHNYDDDFGRLHLSQATLGSGTSTKRTIVQCKVGDKKPINVCSLVPENFENCSLNLEFEEDEEVTFSVIGPHSVHLSGFFLGETGDEGDLDPYAGQTESESDGPLDSDFEDEDSDDFIDDDDDIDMYSSSPIRNSGVKIEEILDDEKPSKENATSKQSKKKKNQKGEPNDSENSGKQLVARGTSGVPVLESEDEDGFPISSPSDKSSKRKIDVVDEDGDPSRKTGGLSDLEAHTGVVDPENDSKQKKRNKKKKVANKGDNGDEISGKGSSTSKDENSAHIEQMPDAEMENGSKSATKKDKEKEKKNKKIKKEKEVVSEAEKATRDKSGSTLELGEKADAKPLQVRTFPNGLVIEELAMGKPDGKKAAPGRKVSVHYIGKLKKNGKIFDSNIGRAPFKFRLGIGEVIKGWDVGVSGMRVGDKRRLTIPPAMGYGAKGAGGAIPPNAWLVFDVELVGVN